MFEVVRRAFGNGSGTGIAFISSFGKAEGKALEKRKVCWRAVRETIMLSNLLPRYEQGLTEWRHVLRPKPALNLRLSQGKRKWNVLDAITIKPRPGDRPVAILADVVRVISRPRRPSAWASPVPSLNSNLFCPTVRTSWSPTVWATLDHNSNSCFSARTLPGRVRLIYFLHQGPTRSWTTHAMPNIDVSSPSRRLPKAQHGERKWRAGRWAGLTRCENGSMADRSSASTLGRRAASISAWSASGASENEAIKDSSSSSKSVQPWSVSISVCRLTRVGFEASQLLRSLTLTDLVTKPSADHESSAPRVECTLKAEGLVTRPINVIVARSHSPAVSEVEVGQSEAQKRRQNKYYWDVIVAPFYLLWLPLGHQHLYTFLDSLI